MDKGNRELAKDEERGRSGLASEDVDVIFIE
jgi:hypothetical protein